MKVLWSISNWKHTGPLEPSLDLAAAFAARGHEVSVAVGRQPEGDRPEAVECVAERGLTLAETGARLHKHSAPWRDARDVRRLRRYLLSASPDAIVTTQRNDHRLMLRAARRAGGMPVARLWFGDGHAALDRRDLAACRESAAVFPFSESAIRQLEDAGVEDERLVLMGPPLDLAALRAQQTPHLDARAALGIPSGPFLIGIVARMQLHRRFEILWEALAQLKERGLPFHFLAIGRGTNQEIVAFEPVRKLGLSEVVTFPGYLRGTAYVDALAALQAQVFLVPGSDPTCRALREGMGLGVPSVSTRRGMLPDIVDDGVTGRLFDDTEPGADAGDGASQLADALAGMIEDPKSAAAMGHAAREKADAFYDTRHGAEEVEQALVAACASSP
jgi:glycosyltransferase involved in cell wall biosynthesis